MPTPSTEENLRAAFTLPPLPGAAAALRGQGRGLPPHRDEQPSRGRGATIPRGDLPSIGTPQKEVRGEKRGSIPPSSPQMGGPLQARPVPP